LLASSLKQKLRDGQECVGLFMTFDFWPGYLELAQRNGIDFVIVDKEHGQVDPSHAETLCRTARLLDLPLMMRPQSCSVDPIKQCLDQGAGGLVLPWMERQEQLDVLREAAFCPPRGRHGMGGPAILAASGVRTADWAQIEDNTFIMCQTETPRGIDFAPTLASQDWIDALMLGPYDLSHNMGLLDEYMKSPEHIAAIERIGAIAHEHGKPAGMVVGNGEAAPAWFERGFDLVICGCVMGHVVQSLARSAQAARGGGT